MYTSAVFTVLLIVLVVLFLCRDSVSAAEIATDHHCLTDRLQIINTRFQQVYERMRQHHIDRILVDREKVIIVDEFRDSVQFYRDNSCSEGPHKMTTPLYDAHKAMAHLPIALA